MMPAEPAVPAVPTEMPTIDEARLLVQTGGDPALVIDVLRLFRDRILPDGRKLLASSDPGHRARLAHKIRGAALGIGALRLAATAGAIEAEGEGSETSFRSALSDLGEEIDRRIGRL